MAAADTASARAKRRSSNWGATIASNVQRWLETGGASPAPETVTSPGRWTAQHSSTVRTPAELILISDPGQDLDDEMALIMARFLEEHRFLKLRGVVATLHPARERARLLRGTLDLLVIQKDKYHFTFPNIRITNDHDAFLASVPQGLPGVPVAAGTDGGDTLHSHSAQVFHNSARYMPSRELSMTIESGRTLLHRLYAADSTEPKSLTLVIFASLKDAALFLRDNEKLFKTKTKEVVIMGGVEAWEAKNQDDETNKESRSVNDNAETSSNYHAVLKPDSANNNTFCSESSSFFYRRCQELGIPLIIVSRHAAYAVKMPRQTYDDLASSGSSIGWRLRNAQRDSIEELWGRAAVTNPQDRKNLPERCDRKWFLETFCSRAVKQAVAAASSVEARPRRRLSGESFVYKKEQGEGKEVDGTVLITREASDSIWDLVDGFMQYDTLALLAAVPSLREGLFDPVEVLSYPLKTIPDQARTEEGDCTEVRKGLPPQPSGQGNPLIEWIREHQPSPLKRSAHEGIVSRETDDKNRSNRDAEQRRDDEMLGIRHKPVRHLIIGASKEQPGIRRQTDADNRGICKLETVLELGFAFGLHLNHHHKTAIVMVLHFRWDNFVDTMLMVAVARSLQSLGIAEIVGFLLLVDQEYQGEPKLDQTQKKAPVTAETEEEPRVANLDEFQRMDLAARVKDFRARIAMAGLGNVEIFASSIPRPPGANSGRKSNTMDERLLSAKEMQRSDPDLEVALKHLEALYELAPPGGLVLVNVASCFLVTAFSDRHRVLFRSKTSRVVLMSGARVQHAYDSTYESGVQVRVREGDGGDGGDGGGGGGGDGGGGVRESNVSSIGADSKMNSPSSATFTPDPEARYTLDDARSAADFFNACCDYSVPIMALTRELFHTCRVPRELFDALGTRQQGGRMGVIIASAMKDSMFDLWRCCRAPQGDPNRKGLPGRCTREWFLQTFCSPHHPSVHTGNDETVEGGTEEETKESIWARVTSVHIYSTLALFASIPALGEHLFGAVEFSAEDNENTASKPALECISKTPTSTIVRIKSASHTVLHRPVSASELRALFYELLFKGALLDASEFSLRRPQPIPTSFDQHDAERADSTMSLTPLPSRSMRWVFNGGEEALAWLKPTLNRRRFGFGAREALLEALEPREIHEADTPQRGVAKNSKRWDKLRSAMDKIGHQHKM